MMLSLPFVVTTASTGTKDSTVEARTGWPSKISRAAKETAAVNWTVTIPTMAMSATMKCPLPPTMAAWTVVVGGKQGLLLRNGSGGHISNALLCNTSGGIEIEDKADEVEDAYERWAAGDLTLNNIAVTGGVDALDYDGDAADGDDLLDAYANDNMVVNGEPEGLDYLFGFDAAGGMANNQLFLNVGQGSGHDFALGWTFCDERQLFGQEFNAVPGCTDEMACLQEKLRKTMAAVT